MATTQDTRIQRLFANAPASFCQKLEDAGDCILWRGTGMKRGYGWFKYYVPRKGRYQILAHRAAYQWHTGEEIVGKLIRHKCDNPRCVNPEHLEPGTYADNARDMVVRNRSAKGERSGKAKLTDAAVRQIRHRAAAGERHLTLAEAFGMARSTITRIVSGNRWRHVE